ncbi:hypothetical protein [Streptomyces sp. NPDC005548]|uniref:zinc finger domain-containing protein n=1 Tax=Streptomyces sp. NPDC005548 TaxID=3364724 RepID=UPI0036BED6CB
MTPADVVMLTAYVHALCPAQKIDQFTPDAWADVFDGVPQYSLADCREGAARVAARQPFVAPAEIIGEVRKIRESRLDDFQYEPTVGETGEESAARRRAQVVACADGRRPPVLAIAGARPRPELQAALKGVAESIALGEDDDEQPVARLGSGDYSQPCPKCEARVGQRCRSPRSGKPRNSPHSERRQTSSEAAPVRDARAVLQSLTADQRRALLADFGAAS